MIRPVAFLKWCGGLALIAAAAAIAPTPASADSFAFSYSQGYARPYHYYHHHPYWGPRSPGSVVVVSPPPVYYAPPPPVVFAPAPVYVPQPVTTAVDAAPASELYRTSDGRYCREYTTTTRVGGVLRSSYGTACLQPDGSWRIVN